MRASAATQANGPGTAAPTMAIPTFSLSRAGVEARQPSCPVIERLVERDGHAQMARPACERAHSGSWYLCAVSARPQSREPVRSTFARSEGALDSTRRAYPPHSSSSVLPSKRSLRRSMIFESGAVFSSGAPVPTAVGLATRGSPASAPPTHRRARDRSPPAVRRPPPSHRCCHRSPFRPRARVCPAPH